MFGKDFKAILGLFGLFTLEGGQVGENITYTWTMAVNISQSIYDYLLLFWRQLTPKSRQRLQKLLNR